MIGNTFGRLFRITACGESYGICKGSGLAVIVDGVPPGMQIDLKHVQAELDKRRPGQSKLDSPRKETDRVALFSGVLEGRTTGAPVGLIIYNVDTQDFHVDQYRQVKHLIRPGHAEYTFFVKYGEHADWCGAGRASGRETVGRVASGAVAKQILAREGIEILAHIVESHKIKARPLSFEEVAANYRKNHLNCCDLDVAAAMTQDIMEIRKSGDTCGGVIEIIARGVPAGLGEPVFDKLKATLAHAILSIGAVTGLEIGAGFDASWMTGSEWNDLPYVDDAGHVRFRTNRSGGLLGGISNGEEIRLRAAVKPTPTIDIEQDSVDMTTITPSKLAAVTRRDASLLPRVYPVCEAMTAVALLDAMMIAKGTEHFARLDAKWHQQAEPRWRIAHDEIIQRSFRQPQALGEEAGPLE